MADPTKAQVQDYAGLPNSVQGIDMAIQLALTFVTDNLTGVGLSSSTLDQIKLLLACHFAILSQEKGPLYGIQIGDVHERYHDHYDKGFALTRFGQMAMSIDTSGTIAQINTNATKPGLKARFTVISPEGSCDEAHDEAP